MMRAWVLGIGPLMVPRQFVSDVCRLDIYVYGKLLPKNVYDALEVLYMVYGSDYYFFTLYATQYMGNRTFDILKREHLICRYFKLYLTEKIEARMIFDVFDHDLKYESCFFCRSIKTKDDFLVYV